ncbi:hypothetical protein [Streptomyces sp. SudanB182_2057]|uniref:hypothetical protein n=1 Tax=Streptomyces sp. SudanB182_2057 TaxID=3035281 RepID=UPI003F550726
MEQLSAGQKLDRAFDKLGEKKTLSFELDLDTDAATLKALDAKSEPEPGDEMPDEAAKLLSDAKITLTVESKKPLAESGEKDLVGMAMKVSSPDGDLAEYRMIGDFIYLRADIDTLGELSGSPVPSADELPPEAGALKDVLQGRWVKFSVKDLEKAGLGGGEDEESPSPAPSLDAKTQQKLMKTLRDVVAREVKLKTAEGDGDTEHITATAPFRTLMTKMIGGIRPLAKDLPPGMDLPTEKDLKKAPNAKVTADFTLKNGELSEVNVDLAKLAETAKVKKLGLVLRMSDGISPTAPAGAKVLDMKQIMQGLFSAPGMSEEEFGDEGFGDGEF